MAHNTGPKDNGRKDSERVPNSNSPQYRDYFMSNSGYNSPSGLRIDTDHKPHSDQTAHDLHNGRTFDSQRVPPGADRTTPDDTVYQRGQR